MLGRAGTDINKSVDAWWTVLLVDPLAVPLTRALDRFAAVTPIRVTLVAHALGLVSAVLFVSGHLAIAAVLFEIRFVLDCVDGKLARLRGVSSNVGRFLDFVGDIAIVSLNLYAIALWASWDDVLHPAAAALLPILFLFMLVCSAARSGEATIAGIADRRPEAGQRQSTGVRARLARRRLRPLPGRVDVEHLVLFVAPLLVAITDEPTILVGAGAGACMFFAYRSAKLLGASLLIARSVDREGRT